MSETPQLLDVQQQLGLLQLVQQLLKHTSTLPRGIPSPTWKTLMGSVHQFICDLPYEVRLLMTRQFLTSLPWAIVWDELVSSEHCKGHTKVVLVVSESEIPVLESLLDLSLTGADSFTTTIKLTPFNSLKVSVKADQTGWVAVPSGAVNLLGDRPTDGSFKGILVTFRLESYPAAPVSVDMATGVDDMDKTLFADEEAELDLSIF
jgi:hypothetical protein